MRALVNSVEYMEYFARPPAAFILVYIALCGFMDVAEKLRLLHSWLGVTETKSVIFGWPVITKVFVTLSTAAGDRS